MRVTMRMPSKKQYNLVTNDELDTRVPLHPDEAFTHGIKFSSKYIGTLDVPRPTSRVEIVAAMRRIRYEFKAKGIKKKKVSLEISVEGVKISLRKKKKQQITDDSQLLLMSHPIYRIFYVSHDSQDLKIFSYIARDASSNVFRCHVFKANKKNQAMRVVRTIGQAFEVCHKMAVIEKSPSPDIHADDISREGSEDSTDKPKKDGQDSESGQEDLITLPSDSYNEEHSENLPLRPSKLEPLPSPIGSDVLKQGETFASPLSELLSSGDYLPQAGTPLSVHHELQLLREQVEQQQQQTQAAVAQVHLLRDQLAAETAARLEAQARTHQLLVHNKDLLEHIQQLVLQVRDLEIKLHGGGGVSGAVQMPPIPTDLSPSTSGASWWVQQHQRQLSRQLSTSLPDTPPTPSPSMGTQTFRFPSAFHSTSPLSAFSHTSSPLSPLISPLYMTSGDLILPVPHQEAQLQRQQQYLQQQLRQRDLPSHLQQKIGHQQSLVRADEGSCSTLSSGDGDHKRDASGGQSSCESVAGAMSHLYNTDHKRLAQVPEDGVPMTQFGNTLSTGAESLLSSQRSPSNGPITRAASERYSRQETLAQMQRMAWARHTTK